MFLPLLIKYINTYSVDLVMAKIELMNAKGTKDFKPEEKIARDKVIDLFRDVFEIYGFSPLETPVIERLDVLSAKYAGGDEILKETFKLKDQGKRDLGLRYDLTVPFSRFVGMNPTMKMPFKRYQMGSVFRDGPIKKGRIREFIQCDVDIVGTKNMVADAEIVKVTQDFFKRAKLDVVIEINNRKLLDGILDSLDIPKNKRIDVILAIDKIKKFSIKDIEKELKRKGVKKVSELLKVFKTAGSNKEKLERLRKFLKTDKAVEGLNEIEEVLSYVNEKNVEFSISLARGLAYYTGTVFEVFMKKGDFKSSLAGGGRYDKMIGDYLGSGDYPAVGISFGVEPILEVMKMNKKIDSKKTVTDVFVIPINVGKKVFKIVDELRKNGIKTDLDLMNRGISKNLSYVNKYGIPYVIFVGEEELKKKKVKLKNMKTGKEEFLDLKAVIDKL